MIPIGYPFIITGFATMHLSPSGFMKTVDGIDISVVYIRLPMAPRSAVLQRRCYYPTLGASTSLSRAQHPVDLCVWIAATG